MGGTGFRCTSCCDVGNCNLLVIPDLEAPCKDPSSSQILREKALWLKEHAPHLEAVGECAHGFEALHGGLRSR